LVLSVLVMGATAHAQWSWQVINYSGELWVNSICSGVYQFQYRIGAGGSIQEIRTSGGVEQLAPPAPRFDGLGTNHTDRVVQGCAWATDVLGSQGPDPRWNVNQSGDSDDDYALIYDVIYYQSASRLDVYSATYGQWNPHLQGQLSGAYAMLTQFYLLDRGAIRIRQVLIAPQIFSNGAMVSRYNFLWQFWAPFKFPDYSTVWSDLDGVFAKAISGQKTPSLIMGSTKPELSNGYYVLSPDVGRLASTWRGTMMAFIYGQQPAVNYGVPGPIRQFESAEYFQDGYQSPEGGIIMYPYLFIDNCQARTVIDQSFILAPQISAPSDYKQLIESLVTEVPPPAVYPAGYALSNDLAQIVPALQQLYKSPGVETNQLGPYLWLRP
jgi:hypothetical protein